jgi:hypothetical protein
VSKFLSSSNISCSEDWVISFLFWRYNLVVWQRLPQALSPLAGLLALRRHQDQFWHLVLSWRPYNLLRIA